MLKRSFEEEEFEEEESENWLASYSDLVTDLMAIFVLLYSFALLTRGIVNHSSIGVLDGSTGVYAAEIEQEARRIAEIDREASRMADIEQEASRIAERLVSEMRMELINAGLEDKVSVNKLSKNRIIMRVGGSVLFDTGKATIKDKAKPVLDEIADIISAHDNVIKYIYIEGHTDNRPIYTSQFPSNWELSAARACSVVRYLTEKCNVADEKFSATGYGEFRPIADNSTEAGKTLNRRVEFVIELNDETGLEELGTKIEN